MSDQPKQTDGTGAPIVDDAWYFIQDARSVVGNCGSWWAPNGAGYVCSIDDAGQYTGAYVRSLRETDVPWPTDYVLARTVRHCRVDNQAFARRDDQKPQPTDRCAACGNPRVPHRYRHIFVEWKPGMPEPKQRGGR